MNRLNTAEIEDVSLDRGLSRMRLVLGLAWKTSVLLLGLAIVLGMSVGPSQPIEVASPGQPQVVKQEGTENRYQVMAHARGDQASYAIEIVDPNRKNKLVHPNREESAYVEFCKDNINFAYINLADHLRVGVSNLQDRAPSANIRTRTSQTIVTVQPDGSVRIQVMSEIDFQETLGELWISSEGEVLPTHRSGF